ncbi:hypothetical protein SY83_16910 [Paenibacillus swuensis]|uniref:Uncharacterized protein n=1 Tax=Paenibacillus swuensis TaxID=1178515 RepID=A0A172TLM5_9BACL|nr:hypothetical protein [Paenibacillus swuensis]ANE47683.1 hypothetical protein SY83_16910 [Paenibacillus swuensis]
MKRNEQILIVIVPMSAIKKFVVIDILASTVIYYCIKFPMHSVIAGTIGSITGPILIRVGLNRLNHFQLRKI